MLATRSGDAVQAIRATHHSYRISAVVAEGGKSVQDLYAAIGELIQRTAVIRASPGSISIDIA